ncbi:MAG: hypothetical protein ACOYMN_16505, partial [Roseimicrobium sp.]
MNPVLPPLSFRHPEIRKCRQQKQGFVDVEAPSPEQRRATTMRVLAEKQKVDEAMAQLTPEQRRAVILKLRHDRPLVRADLQGTGLSFLGEPGESESLAIPKSGDLSKLGNRASDYEAGRTPSIL